MTFDYQQRRLDRRRLVDPGSFEAMRAGLQRHRVDPLTIKGVELCSVKARYKILTAGYVATITSELMASKGFINPTVFVPYLVRVERQLKKPGLILDVIPLKLGEVTKIYLRGDRLFVDMKFIDEHSCLTARTMKYIRPVRLNGPYAFDWRHALAGVALVNAEKTPENEAPAVSVWCQRYIDQHVKTKTQKVFKASKGKRVFLKVAQVTTPERYVEYHFDPDFDLCWAWH